MLFPGEYGFCHVSWTWKSVFLGEVSVLREVSINIEKKFLACRDRDAAVCTRSPYLKPRVFRRISTDLCWIFSLPEQLPFSIHRLQKIMVWCGDIATHAAAIYIPHVKILSD